MKQLNVLQFICPKGFYGAERWVLALANNSDPCLSRHDLAVTKESEEQNLEIVDQFVLQGGKAFEIPMSGRFDLTSIKALCKIIREREIDVIHTHGYKSDILGYIAAKITGIKCVSTPPGFGEVRSFKLKVLIKIGGWVLPFFDKVVPLSKELFDDCLSMGVPVDKLAYIQNGVDLKEVDEVHKKKQPPSAGKIKRIGFIGQMIPRKKITHILDIFEGLYSKKGDVELCLLGDGESRAELEDHKETLSAKDAIDFLGFQNDRLEHLKDFDLFVMTSSSEGIPRCLMEAMAMEIPVAAYDIQGIDQLVVHESSGLLATFGDQETLSGYWEKLLYDPNYAKEIAANGRKFVLENFSAARMAREYTELFDKLCR